MPCRVAAHAVVEITRDAKRHSDRLLIFTLIREWPTPLCHVPILLSGLCITSFTVIQYREKLKGAQEKICITVMQKMKIGGVGARQEKFLYRTIQISKICVAVFHTTKLN